MAPWPTRDYTRASVVSPARAPVRFHVHAQTSMHVAASALCFALFLRCPWDVDIEMLSATHEVPHYTYFFSGMVTWLRRSCE